MRPNLHLLYASWPLKSMAYIVSFDIDVSILESEDRSKVLARDQAQTGQIGFLTARRFANHALWPKAPFWLMTFIQVRLTKRSPDHFCCFPNSRSI